MYACVEWASMLSRVHRQVALHHTNQVEAVQQPATASQLLQQQQQLQEQLLQQQQQLQKQLQEQQHKLQHQLSQQQQQPHQIAIQYGFDQNSQDAEGVKTEDGSDSKKFQKHLVGVGHLLVEQPPQQQPLNLVTTSMHHTSTVHTPSVSL